MRKLVTKIRRRLSFVLKTKQEKRHALVGAGNLWKMKRDFQIKFLIEQGLLKTDRLMDIGCGTLRGGIPMIQYLNKGNYYGMDVREHVLNEGREELKTAKLEDKNPNLILFDHFSEVNIDVQFNVMFAFSVLIHLEDEIAESCFQFIGNSLSKKGVFYSNVNIGEYRDGYWQGFPVVFRSMDFYNKLAIKNGMNIEVIGSLSELGHVTGKESDKQQIMLKITKN